MKLAIIDYGIGGIGLYKLIREKTAVDIVYFSDAGNTPYGKLPKDSLAARFKQIEAFLESRRVTHIAVACNALSTAIKSSDNIQGIIAHGINTVLDERLSSVGVVGGTRTIQSNIYRDAFTLSGLTSQQQVAQQLSIRIEAGDISSPGLTKDIEQIFAPLKNEDAILLACTHYPVVADQIQAFLPGKKLLDPGVLFANWITSNWPTHFGNGKDEWYTTGDVETTTSAIEKCYDLSIDNFEQVQLK